MATTKLSGADCLEPDVISDAPRKISENNSSPPNENGGETKAKIIKLNPHRFLKRLEEEIKEQETLADRQYTVDLFFIRLAADFGRNMKTRLDPGNPEDLRLRLELVASPSYLEGRFNPDDYKKVYYVEKLTDFCKVMILGKNAFGSIELSHDGQMAWFNQGDILVFTYDFEQKLNDRMVMDRI